VSIHTVERVLFDLASGPSPVADYKAHPQKFLSAYPLAADEVRMIMEMDVRMMVDRSLNHMMAMRGFIAVEGRDRMPEYFRRLREN